MPSAPVDPASTIRLRCFGSPALLQRLPGGVETTLLPPGKPLFILAYLVAHHPAGATRDALALLGWGSRDEAHAKASLRQVLYRLRQTLGQGSVFADDSVVRLSWQTPSDWSAATAALTAGDDAALIGEVTGLFLEGADDDEHFDLGSWIATERSRWTLAEREAAIREGRKALTAGAVEASIALLERALATRDDHLDGWKLYLEALRATEMPGRLEDGVARLTAAGEHGLLGVTEPAGWRLLAQRQRRSSSDPSPATTATTPAAILPFTGRDALLGHIQALLTLPPEQSRRVVAVVAGPGFGKSRLLRELRARLVAAAVRLSQVEAMAWEAATPWGLCNRIVADLCAFPEATGIEPHAAAHLVALNPQLRERFSGISASERALPDPEEVAAALAELIAAVSEHHPLHLLIDDLQWCDQESLGVLRAAFARPGPGKAVALVTSRDDATLQPPEWYTLHLPSLAVEDLEVLIASQLPMVRPADRTEAATSMLLVTGGVPIYVARALQRLDAFARAQRHDPGDRLLAAIATLTLHRDPGFPTADGDRLILGYLAVAGGATRLAELQRLLGATPAEALEERLGRLRQQGWIVGDDNGISLSHDLVLRQVIEVVPAAQRRVLALQRAHWLAEHGEALHDLQSAVRLCLAHAAPGQAAAAVQGWRQRVHGGPQGRTLATLVLPSDADRLLWWRMVAAATPALLWWIVAACGLVGIGGWSAMAWLLQPAVLELENTPRVPPSSFYGDEGPLVRIKRNTLAPRFTVRDRFGKVTDALDGESLRVVGASPGVDSFRMFPLPVIRNGSVTAESLLAFKQEPEAYAMTFQAGTLRSSSVTMFSGFSAATLSMVGGELNGSRLASDAPEVVVAPGDSLRGRVLLRYTTPAHAALWMLAESSTMQPLGSDTTTVLTLYTGVTDALAEVIVRRRVPTRPGNYWLVWAFAAEPAAEWIFSLTNWRCVTPHWNDGRDLLMVPDSVLAKVGAGGFLKGTRDLCNPGEPLSKGESSYPAVVLRIVVKGG